MALDVINFMDALKIDKAIIAGFDWGARSADIIAALWPERCKGLVSVSGYLIGDQASGILHHALNDSPSVEMERRLKRLVDGLDAPLRQPDEVRATRAVEVLERINTADARQLLESLAKGDPTARLTREAAASLQRLAARPVSEP